MWPVLLSIGPVTIYAYGVFLLLALFVGLYWWWKMGRDEHWDEIELFDGYFLSLLIFFASSRAVYVLLHPELQTWYRAIAFLAYPGLSIGAGIVAAIFYLVFFARGRDWDSWKMLDVLAVALSVILAIGSIGAVLNGSNPGIVSSWGFVHPGDTVTRLPVDVWTLVWGLLTFGVVSRVRKQFRFYAWYKGEASVARDGLAFLVFGGLSGVYMLVAGLIDDLPWHLGVVPVWSLLGAAIMAWMFLWIRARSGRGRGGNLLQWVSRRRQTLQTEREK